MANIYTLTFFPFNNSFTFSPPPPGMIVAPDKERRWALCDQDEVQIYCIPQSASNQAVIFSALDSGGSRDNPVQVIHNCHVSNKNKNVILKKSNDDLAFSFKIIMARQNAKWELSFQCDMGKVDPEIQINPGG